MAKPSSDSRGASHGALKTRRPVASMSVAQLQAYLTARETLRRVKASATPWVARGVPIGGSPPPES